MKKTKQRLPRKKVNKKILSSIAFSFIGIIIIIGLIFSCVPMAFGQTNYKGLIANLRKSSDITNAVYAEYDIVGNYSENQLNSAKNDINKILSKYGYINNNIFVSGSDKLRVEVTKPDESYNLSTVSQVLDQVNSGLFDLRLATSDTESYLNGREHIEKIYIQSYREVHYVTVKFNKEGKERFKKLTTDASASSSACYYVFMGGKPYPSESGAKVEVKEVNSEGIMTLGFEDYTSAEYYMLAFNFGCLNIELNSDSQTTGTMTNIYSYNSLCSSSLYAALIIASLIIIIALIILLAVRYKLLGLMAILCFTIMNIFGLIILNAMTWIEFNSSAVFGMLIAEIILILPLFLTLETMREEALKGKTISASISTGFEKILFPTIIITSMCLGMGLIMSLCGVSSMKVFGSLISLFAILSATAGLGLLRGFIMMLSSYHIENPKLYGMQTTSANEEETIDVE
ncbi:MAG: hypothetical protein RR334_02335 [Clostridia bacterium]